MTPFKPGDAYAALREMDQSRLQNLYVVLPNQDQPKSTDWLAITSRLRRATSQNDDVGRPQQFLSKSSSALAPN